MKAPRKELTARREALGLTATRLGDYFGSSRQYISALEAGQYASEQTLTELESVLSKLEKVAEVSAVLIQPKRGKKNKAESERVTK